MKVFIVIFALGAVASASDILPKFIPDNQKNKADKPVDILRQTKILDPASGYDFGYVTSDGTKVNEFAIKKTVGKQEILNVQGQYSYYAPDGKLYSVAYTADENGFHVVKDDSQKV